MPNARGSRTCFSIRSLPIRARIYGSGSSARADCSPTPTRICGEVARLPNFVPVRPIDEIARELINFYEVIYEPARCLRRAFDQTALLGDTPGRLRWRIPQFHEMQLMLSVIRQHTFGFPTRWTFWRYLLTIAWRWPTKVYSFLIMLAYAQDYFDHRLVVRKHVSETAMTWNAHAVAGTTGPCVILRVAGVITIGVEIASQVDAGSVEMALPCPNQARLFASLQSRIVGEPLACAPVGFPLLNSTAQGSCAKSPTRPPRRVFRGERRNYGRIIAGAMACAHVKPAFAQTNETTTVILEVLDRSSQSPRQNI